MTVHDDTPSPAHTSHVHRPLARPLKFSAIFSMSFALIRRNPGPMLLAAALAPFALNAIVTLLAFVAQWVAYAALTRGPEGVPLAFTALGGSYLQTSVASATMIFTQSFVLMNLREATLGAVADPFNASRTPAPPARTRIEPAPYRAADDTGTRRHGPSA